VRRWSTIAGLLLALVAIAPARAGSVRWERAETEHFLFVFEPRDRAAADELLTFCEDVYAKVTGFFRSYPAKVPCVIRGGLDYANGGTGPFPARIELIVTAPSSHWMGARTESYLRILLTHELTHFVHLTMDRGPFAALSRVLGRDAAMGSAIFLPGWMVEGPATNLETIFTAGGRGRNPMFEIYSKAPIVEADMFSLRQAGFDSAFPPHGRIYVAGNILVEHILATYGEDSFTRIMDAYLAFPFFGPWAAIEKVTGRKGSDVYEDMRVRLAERHRASARTAGGTLVTPDGIGDYWRPQPTSAGLYLYRSTPERHPAIVRYDPGTRGEKVLLDVALTDEASFCSTADGRTIYFTTLAYDWRMPGMGEAVSDLYSLDPGTGKIRQITRGAHLWQPAVSRDGRRLAAVQGTGSYTRLVEVDLRTGSVGELYSRAESNVYNPAFSPDAGRLAFTLNIRGFQDIAVLSLGRGEPGDSELVGDAELVGRAELVSGPDPAGEYYPAFLADGRLLYCSDRTGNLCLYLADLETGESSLAVEDPVAAIAGIDDAGGLIYSSYSSKGFCLKTIPIADLRSTPAEAVPPAPYPLAFEWTGRAIPSRPYHDIPLPYLWYPWLPFGTSSTGGIDIGIGAAALGGSLLGISSWSLGAAWHPLTNQPTVALELASALGNLRIGGRLSLDSTFASSLSVSLPLVSRNTLGRGFSLVARTGLFFDASRELASPAGSWDPSLSVWPGVGLRWQQTGSQIDFYPPRDFSAGLDCSFPLPAFSPITPPQRFLLFLSGSVPSVFAHHVVKLGAKASYTLGATVMFYDGYVTPRGAFALAPRTGPGVVLGSLDYLIPVALLDVPLLLGLGLTGIGVGVHAEWGGEYGLAPARVLPHDPFFVGLEVTLQLTAGLAEFPLGVGLAARIATAAGGFDPARDLRPYLFFSFDSFRDAARDISLPHIGGDY
jgi:hypothetical protein